MTRPDTVTARYDVLGPGHDAYRDLLAVLGPGSPEIVGWCAIDIDSKTVAALVVTSAWPFLPFGADPRAVKKARRYAALIPQDGSFGGPAWFRVVEISDPQAALAKQAAEVIKP